MDPSCVIDDEVDVVIVCYPGTTYAYSLMSAALNRRQIRDHAQQSSHRRSWCGTGSLTQTPAARASGYGTRRR